LPILGLIMGAVGVVGYSHWVEPFRLEVTRRSIVLPNLPTSLDGLVVAQLSDFHLHHDDGPNGAVSQAVAACNAARPDVVVLTGDYLGERRAVTCLEETLSNLTVRPAFAVLGNHDYRFGPKCRRMIERCFSDLGIELLDNRAAAYERDGARVWFVGVGDGLTSHDRLDEALKDLGEGDRPRILLCHYPDLLCDLPTDRFDLTLAGHTHGAQIHLPFLAQAALRRSDTHFDRGFYEVRGSPMYVNRGLGTSGRRFRLFSPPELTLLTLHGACGEA
jgi:predicted MPP superfamily phosphohydrolase